MKFSEAVLCDAHPTGGPWVLGKATRSSRCLLVQRSSTTVPQRARGSSGSLSRRTLKLGSLASLLLRSHPLSVQSRLPFGLAPTLAVLRGLHVVGSVEQSHEPNAAWLRLYTERLYVLRDPAAALGARAAPVEVEESNGEAFDHSMPINNDRS